MGSDPRRPKGWLSRLKAHSCHRLPPLKFLVSIGTWLIAGAVAPVAAAEEAGASQSLNGGLALGLIIAVLGAGLYLQSSAKRYR